MDIYIKGHIYQREKNPIKNIEKNLNLMLKRWLNNEFITKQKYFCLMSSDSILPKAYGLSKIHKENYPFRIIISSINTALYPLAKFLHNLISDNVTIHNNSHVNNSFELKESFSELIVGDVLILMY